MPPDQLPADEYGRLRVDHTLYPYKMKFHRKLGSGAFGTVYLVELQFPNELLLKSSSKYTAVKRVSVAGEELMFSNAKVVAEWGTLRLKHPLVRQIFAVQVSSIGTFDIIFSRSYNTDLDWLCDNVLRNLPLERRKAFLKVSLSSLGWCLIDLFIYLRSQNTVHADIKPGNVVLNLEGTDDDAADCDWLALADWGSCFTLPNLNSITHDVRRGTQAYRPPEASQEKDPFLDVTADLYSIGATLYYLCELKEWEAGGQFECTPEEWRDRLTQWLSPDPSKRLPQARDGALTLRDFATSQEEFNQYARRSPQENAAHFCQCAALYTKMLKVGPFSAMDPIVSLPNKVDIVGVYMDPIKEFSKLVGTHSGINMDCLLPLYTSPKDSPVGGNASGRRGTTSSRRGRKKEQRTIDPDVIQSAPHRGESEYTPIFEAKVGHSASAIVSEHGGPPASSFRGGPYNNLATPPAPTLDTNAEMITHATSIFSKRKGKNVLGMSVPTLVLDATYRSTKSVSPIVSRTSASLLAVTCNLTEAHNVAVGRLMQARKRPRENPQSDSISSKRSRLPSPDESKGANLPEHMFDFFASPKYAQLRSALLRDKAKRHNRDDLGDIREVDVVQVARVWLYRLLEYTKESVQQAGWTNDSTTVSAISKSIEEKFYALQIFLFAVATQQKYSEPVTTVFAWLRSFREQFPDRELVQVLCEKLAWKVIAYLRQCGFIPAR